MPVGETKQTPPHALLVRSGDVIVLAGESRRFYHGVPRIFSDKPSALPLEPQEVHSTCPPNQLSLEGFADFMRTRRVNISIRETV